MIANLALLALAVAAPAMPPRVLTLDQALETARAHQPLLRQAAASTQAALARSDEAMAPLLPQVSGTADYQRSTANFTSRPGSLPSQFSGGAGAGSWNTYNFFNLGLNASQLLYDFGQSRSRWRSAQATAAAQGDTERSTVQQVLFNVRAAYYQARAANGLVKVATDTLANQEKHLQQTEGFVEAGTQAEIALAQSRTDVANARVQLITAQNGYETAKAQLNNAMGVESAADYDVTDETQAPVEGEDGTTDTLLGEALQSRPELAALANEVRSQELTLRAVRASLGPSVGFSTGFSDAGEQFSNLTWNWNAAVGITIPIFQGGITRAQIRESEANVASATAQLDTERQQVRLEIEQARLAVRAAKAALTAAGDALVNAQEQLRLAEGRYETGVGSIIELGDSQVALTSAGQQKVQAEYVLAQARAQLVRALGRD